MKKENIKKSLSATIKEIEKKFGSESIMLMGENKEINIETFPSGSYLLDKAMGIGGYPRGRIIEIFGSESSGKTTLALQAIASIQKLGGIAAFIDAEHSIDPKYARNLGVKVDELILSQPDSGEQALEIADTLIKTGAIDLIVIDSVAALVPEAELMGEMRDQSVGGQARLMSKALRKITASTNQNKTTIIFINQVREKIGILFGNPEITPGGRALKFYSSIRIEVRKTKQIGGSENTEYRGNELRVKIVKNKLAAPYKTFTTEIVFAEGISLEAEILDAALEAEIVQRKGTWYYYNDEKFAQGRIAGKDYLKAHPELLEKIKVLLAEKNKLK